MMLSKMHGITIKKIKKKISFFLTRVSMHLIFCQGNFIFERSGFLLPLIFSNSTRLSATVLDYI